MNCNQNLAFNSAFWDFYCELPLSKLKHQTLSIFDYFFANFLPNLEFLKAILSDF